MVKQSFFIFIILVFFSCNSTNKAVGLESKLKAELGSDSEFSYNSDKSLVLTIQKVLPSEKGIQHDKTKYFVHNVKNGKLKKEGVVENGTIFWKNASTLTIQYVTGVQKNGDGKHSKDIIID